MSTKDRIQFLLMSHLNKAGSIDLSLPSGMKLSLGITKESKHGVEKCDDYCWVQVDLHDKSVSLDEYNMGLQFSQDRMVFETEEDNLHVMEII